MPSLLKTHFLPELDLLKKEEGKQAGEREREKEGVWGEGRICKV